jgi:hypothetical protein
MKIPEKLRRVDTVAEPEGDMTAVICKLHAVNPMNG